MVMGEVLCLYGSVTGKAESIAQQVAERALVLGYTARLHGLGEVGAKWDLSAAATLVIVSSTTGDGEQPENVIKFWRKLRPKSLPPSHLRHLQYALLGLGDTNYNEFCGGPRALHRRLAELGARELLPPAWADDGTGLEGVVEPWLEELWPALAKAAGDPVPGLQAALDTLAIAEPGVTLPPRPEPYILVSHPAAPAPAALLPRPPLPSAAGPLLPGKLVTCRRLTAPEAAKHYYLAELQLTEPLLYRAGDTIAVVCPNTEADLARLRDRLDLGSDWTRPCTICLDPDTKKKKASLPAWLPTEATLDTLFRHHLDIRAVPKKLLLRSLMEHATSPADRTFLGRLCSREGAAEYLATVREPRLGLLELLALAPSCRPPAALLLEHLPRLQPRPYSLASCPAGGSASTLSFLFTLVTAPRAGLATSWLADAAPGTAVPLYLRTGGAFVPPADLAESYMMVAAGSGLGPFLAFLQDRRARLGAAGSAPIGSCWLFFGCRSRSRDYIMQELLEEMLEAGVLSRLTVSFSREEGGGAKYVQDSMKEHEGEIIDLLTERGASLYVCGDAKGMARGVQAALEEMMVGVKGLEPEVAAHAVKDLRLNKKYLEDIWT